MSLKETAAQTLQILETGYFLTPDGERIPLQPALSQAVSGTRLYTPEQATQVMQSLHPKSAQLPTIEVTDCA